MHETVADTFDAMNILVDSSGCEFDPNVTKGRINWIRKTICMIGRNVDKLTLDDLPDYENVDRHNYLIPVLDASTTYDLRT